MAQKSQPEPSTAVVVKRASENLPALDTFNRVFSDEELQGIKTFDEAVALATQVFSEISPADQVIGNGFAILQDKAQLIGVPLLLMEWKFTDGENGRFVSIVTVARTENGQTRRLIVNDGSTGIMEQLAEYTNRKGVYGGLLVKRGLRESRFQFTDNNGNTKWASTFYLDTSA